jgi:ABC-type sugar transport system permease subunit
VTTARDRLTGNRNALGLIFPFPAAAMLLLFLTYPIGIGVWLGFTDTKVGRGGSWVRLENYAYRVTDSVAQLSLSNTFFYTLVAGAIKFTLPLLTPIIAVVMTFSVLFTFTDLQLIYVLTRGGPLNATHLMATLSFQRAIPGGALGEGAALAVAMVPFLLAAILFSYFGLQRRAWQQGGKD